MKNLNVDIIHCTINNCPLIFMVTTKQLLPNEELYTYYGESYMFFPWVLFVDFEFEFWYNLYLKKEKQKRNN